LANSAFLQTDLTLDVELKGPESNRPTRRRPVLTRFEQALSGPPPIVAAGQGRRALICTDERFARTAAFREIVAALEAASITVFVYDRALPDAPLYSSSKDADRELVRRPSTAA
jgi:hypothetical protein